MNRSRALRPTIKDVAREASVSLSTVSYVLSNSAGAQRISEATRQRVWATAERLGYKRNAIARDLQRGYTNQVTLLIVSWNLATSHSATAMAISRAAARSDLTLNVHVADNDASALEYVRRTGLHHQGGVLVLWDSPAFRESALRELAIEGTPVVDLLPGDDDAVSVVTADREDAGFRATEYLARLGHRRIGVICDLESRPKTTIQKLAGYRRALDTLKLPYDGACVQNTTEFGFEGGQDGMRRLLERCRDISAVFCINDPIALGAIAAAASLGRACPRDLSVIGFGDAPEGRYWRPSLTTFALSPNRVAQAAIESILAWRDDPAAPPRKVLIPEDLILRESTGTI